jgi:putative tryptophan/tyrosine transport system substrate-binding protein
VRRREFISLLSGAAATWPLVAQAQQSGKMPVIGLLGSESPRLWADWMPAFHEGLGQAGYAEGRNVAIEYRWAEGHYDRLPALAAELTRQQVNVIAVPGSNVAAVAAKAATATIPIVFGMAGDPVRRELVASLNRPGSNVTGVTSLNSVVDPKRVELMHEVMPAATTLALLDPPATARSADAGATMEATARALGIKLHVLHVEAENDFDAAFATVNQLKLAGLVILGSAFFTSRFERLAELAARHRVPTIYQYREFVAAGALMSYGTRITEQYRLVGSYTGRILKGDKPADLPVQQATRVELIINMKAAKALGVTLPITVLGRADEVIE